MASASVLEESQSLILSILLLAPILCLYLRHRLSKAAASNLPPGPHPWPIIGNLPQIITTLPHVATAQLAQIHGPLFSLRLGSQLLVVASSPAAAMEILKNQDKILSGRYVPHVSYAKAADRNHLSMGWTYECNERWRFLRTLCRNHLFASKAIDDQARVRETKVEEMVRFIKSKEGEILNIAELVFATTFNALGNIFFSMDLISFGEGREKEMIGMTRRMVELWTTPNISDFYPLLGGLDLQGLRRKAHKYCNEFCMVWESTVRQRRRGKSSDVRKDRDFLDVLLDSQLSDDRINYLLLELLSAGTDTTTSTVDWAMVELLKKPETMNKVRDELDSSIIRTGTVQESQLQSLTYLDACVKETLRLHPPAPLLIPRRAAETCKVMNYDIPKDSQVLVNVWAIGRDPSVWEDPLSYRPERFVNSNLDFKGNNFEFLPFGSGRRVCVGLPMANRQVHLLLASLLYHFEWFLPEGVKPHQLDMNEKFGVTLLKEKPLVVIPRRRK